MSFVRHGDEVSLVLVAGKRADFEEESKSILQPDDYYVNAKPFLQQDRELKAGAVALPGTTDLVKTIVLARYDLGRETEQVRYVLTDLGSQFKVITDDPSVYPEEDLAHDAEMATTLAENAAELSEYEVLFGLCRSALQLPKYFAFRVKAATSSKRRDLRALPPGSNPCIGVEPPGDRDSRKGRRKSFLYPREAAALLSCPKVPLAWREVYAVALYTYLRPGELRVLTWADIDHELTLMHVTKAWDYAEAIVKPPKTRNGVRRVPIAPTLVPLLHRLREGRADTDLVVPEMTVFGEDHLAKLWRRHLIAAGITRAELHNTTHTHVRSNFRSCRDSGLTWLALADVDATKIMRRAGHDHIQTTMGYVKMAEDLAGDLGVPFAPLPEGPASSGGVLVFWSEKTPKPPVKGHARRDSNPRHAASKAAALSS